MIGNGKDTRIWKDPWIPSAESFETRQMDVQRSGNEPFYVSDLIEEGKWKHDTLSILFTPWEVQLIRQIPLPLHDIEGTWMWKHTQSGGFLVQSAYYVELLEERKQKPSTSSSTHEKARVWKWLWSSKIQPKVKLFGWKSMHNGVPVRVNLARRGMQVDQVCPRCGEAAETLEHMLIQCEVSQRM